MDETSLSLFLRSISQGHLLEYWKELNSKEREFLTQQINRLNLELLSKQKKLITHKDLNKTEDLVKPYKNYIHSGNLLTIKKGLSRIADGKVGCMIVAGGQGTRLGWDGPKGTFPITLIKHKSLFQFFAEKLHAASLQAGRRLYVAIMTSPLNDEETKQFFRDNDFFDLKPDQIDFFIQGTLPFLNENGDLFLASPSQIAEGPDGNGLSLKSFWESGIGEKWKSLGIEDLNYILIDNPLADPFDPELAGFHHEFNHDVTIKCTERLDPQENVGVIVKKDNQIRVIEYTELKDEDKGALDKTGRCLFSCANLSLFCFKLSFIEKNLSNFNSMPLHFVKKPVQSTLSKDNQAWKFEFFIFDVLKLTKKIGVLLYPREYCFSPLKNRRGKGSIATVQESLQYLDRVTYSQISGREILDDHPFELSQSFYYPTPELLKKWHGIALPNHSYIAS